MTVLEHIKSLSHTLSPDQRIELSEYLRQPNGDTPSQVVSLRGRWKDKFPADLDPIAAVREIRDSSL